MTEVVTIVIGIRFEFKDPYTGLQIKPSAFCAIQVNQQNVHEYNYRLTVSEVDSNVTWN